MSHIAKLSLAVGLALAAAVLNAMWLNAEKRPSLYVAASGDLKAGEEIREDALVAVPIPGDPEELRSSLIPYSKRSILLGMTAPRDYSRGDMLFQRDIQAPLETAQFEVLGPFRLISVGERFKMSGGDSADSAVDPGGNNITIAVGADFDERTRRLLQTIDPNRKSSASGKAPRIVAVQVIPSSKQSGPQVLDDKNVVYQTVSLQGIENVPRVLLEGEVVRFVVPSNDSI